MGDVFTNDCAALVLFFQAYFFFIQALFLNSADLVLS
jgi:hypothetical protein